MRRRGELGDEGRNFAFAYSILLSSCHQIRIYRVVHDVLEEHPPCVGGGGLYFPFYNITLQPTASARSGQLSVLLIERTNELWVAIV